MHMQSMETKKAHQGRNGRLVLVLLTTCYVISVSSALDQRRNKTGVVEVQKTNGIVFEIGRCRAWTVSTTAIGSFVREISSCGWHTCHTNGLSPVISHHSEPTNRLVIAYTRLPSAFRVDGPTDERSLAVRQTATDSVGTTPGWSGRRGGLNTDLNI